MRFIEEGLAALIASLLAVGVMAVLIDSDPPEERIVTLRIPETLPTAPVLTTTTVPRPTASPRDTTPPATSRPASPSQGPGDDAITATVQAAAQRVICRSLTGPEVTEFVQVYRSQPPGLSVEEVADAWLKQQFLAEARQCFLQYAGGRS